MIWILILLAACNVAVDYFPLHTFSLTVLVLYALRTRTVD